MRKEADSRPVSVSYAEWKKNPAPVTAKSLFGEMPLETFIDDWMTITSSEDDETYGSQVPFRLWPKQRELCRYIEETKIGFIAKARQRGGSELFACAALKILLSEDGSEVLIFSRSEPDARLFLDERVKPKLKSLPRIVNDAGEECIIWPKINQEMFKIESSYGSSIKAISSHPDSGSGHTSRLVLLDEMEKIEGAKDHWLSVKPAVSQNKKGQLFALSTGQRHGTFFKSFLRKIYDGKVNGISLFFLPSNADPSKDEEWYAREKTQFDSEVDMRCTYPSQIEDIFLSKEGKVFPHFNNQEGGRHVWDFEKKFKPSVLWTMDMYLAYDPGYEPHPAAFLLCLYDRTTDILYVVEELVLIGVEIGEIGNRIRNIVQSKPVRPKKAVVDTYANRRSGLGGKITEATVLKEITGINWVGANKADADGSRQLLSRRLSEDKIVFHPRVVATRRQMEDWVWGANGKPVDHDDDTIDDLRYICQVLPNRPQSPPQPKRDPDPYTPEARKARAMAKAKFEAAKNPNSGTNNYEWQAL